VFLGVPVPTERSLKPMNDTSESFLLKVAHIMKATFERKLSDVAYTLAQVFTSESQLSQIERVCS